MLICGRYDATGGMHAGGMSQAYDCVDTRLNRRVILKTLHRKEEIRRLSDEKKALLKIRSKHVVQLLDIIEFESAGANYPCLVLEYIQGKDLVEGSYNQDDIYLLHLWQIAKGLEEIHSAGLIHRDIKPNNIRLDGEGIIKIIDFGLSRETGRDDETHAAIGHLPYMAPELLGPPPMQFSCAADVYSFGALALALVAPGMPTCLNSHKPTIPNDLAASHLNAVPPEIQESVQKCLNYQPADRPRISEIVASIERVLLRGRHSARVSIGGKVSLISQQKRSAQPSITVNQVPVAAIKIDYDLNNFIISNILGVVDINNSRARVGDVMPQSCVLAFHHAHGQIYATFDASSPEVMP
jgi:eukaryotic-like serine/threonine-protein kinase